MDDKPHDAFFKALLAKEGVPGALLRERLPAEVSALLADEPPEAVVGSFVDEALRQSQSDALFRVRTKQGRAALVYVLVEHKSRRDRDLGLQLLKYKARILERERAAVPIFTLVVYNGRARWTGSRRFSDDYAVDGALKPLLLDFPFGLVDLGAVEDGALSTHECLRGGLRALKYATRPKRQRAELVQVLLALRGEDGMPWGPLVAYVVSAYRQVNREAMMAAAAEVAPGRTKQMMSLFAEEMLKQGRDEGRVEGRTQGAAAMLLNLLSLRFSAVPSATRERIAHADESTLLRWSGRVLTARSIDDVLD